MKTAFEQFQEITGGHEGVVTIAISTLSFLIDDNPRLTPTGKQTLIDFVVQQLIRERNDARTKPQAKRKTATPQQRDDSNDRGTIDDF